MPVDVVSYLYAATVAAGGIIGYVKAGNEIVNKHKYPHELYGVYSRVRLRRN